MSSYIVPIIVGFIVIYGLFNGVDVFSEFIIGAKEGITTAINILPSLIALITCVGMFRASGGLDVVANIIHSIIPMQKELIPLALLRPISGSGALVIFEDILKQNGPDSLIGRMASVLQGSTETTFYVIAVYFGSKIQIRHTAVCAIFADIIAFTLAMLLVK